MSFKDEYKESYDSIVPDQTFLDRLSRKMKQEEQKKHKSRKPLVAAACLCLLVLAGVMVWNAIYGLPKTSEPVSVNTGTSVKDPTAKPNLFDTSRWYHEGDSADKIFTDFVGRLRDAGLVEAVYKNSENLFTDDMILSSKEIQSLAEMIKEAEEVSDKPDDMGEMEYYMAEFKNGDIIKFVLTDRGYFSFLDLDAVYKY